MKDKLTSKITIRAMLIALAFVLSWLESQIPYCFAIPGIKLGLSNLVVLIALYYLSPADAFVLNMVRIILVSFTFSSMAALPYSLAGGMLSFIAMYLLKRFTGFSIRLVSVFGGICHNIGQILVAMIVLENTSVIWYLPYLWISGIAAGVVIGLICEMVLRRLPAGMINREQ